MIHIYSLISIFLLIGIVVYIWRQNEEEKRQRKLWEQSWLERKLATAAEEKGLAEEYEIESGKLKNAIGEYNEAAKKLRGDK